LTSPEGINTGRQRQALDAINSLNAERYAATGDSEIASRISAFELAFRMQTSGSELVDLRGESKGTLDLYGCDPDKPSFARNCLLARRLVGPRPRLLPPDPTDRDPPR